MRGLVGRRTRSAPGGPHARLSDRPTGCLRPWWGGPGWRNGRRGGLKIPCPHGRGGWRPHPRTASKLATALSTDQEGHIGHGFVTENFVALLRRARRVVIAGG